MVIEIRLFGVLKRFGENGMLVLEIPCSCSVSELRSRIKQALAVRFPAEFHTALVDRAALADEHQVLSEDQFITDSPNLALLPPVCGG
ncbi:MAG: hypothetical protein DCC75_12940 [Proteobacteria bacterium]|nr:MAG: hypothetical protein DCC75_12940 [Pseudomonadota bacterium]